MGTKARFTIRYKHITYNYWLSQDGYLSGAGDDICNGIRKLSEEFSLDEICDRIIEIDPNNGEQPTTGEQIYDIINNLGGCCVDNDEDFEYCYLVDFDKCQLTETGQTQLTITFDEINNNTQISGNSVIEYESDESESEESEEENSDECDDGEYEYDQ